MKHNVRLSDNHDRYPTGRFLEDVPPYEDIIPPEVSIIKPLKGTMHLFACVFNYAAKSSAT